MIFQKQFAFTVAERMFKIKQIFIKKIASNKSICHM